MATLQEQNTVGTATQVLNAYTPTNDGDARKAAQKITASGNYTITSLKLKLLKVGSPPGDLTVEIRNWNSGTDKPTGTVLGSGTIPASSVTTSFIWRSASRPYLLRTPAAIEPELIPEDISPDMLPATPSFLAC